MPTSLGLNLNLPFPYGPVPSATVPSTRFMDLFGTQTAAGNKTFSGLTTFSRPAQAGTAETHQEFRVDDDAVGLGRIGNYTGTNGAMVMMEHGIGALSTEFAHAWVAQAGASADSGTLPLGIFQAVNNAIAALANRPPFGWYNGANLRMQMAASGAMTYTIGAQTGGAEEIARWRLGDDVDASLVLTNGDSTNGVFVPVLSWFGTIGGAGFTAGQQRVRLGAGMDTGSTPAMAYFFQTSTGAALASRPLCGWYSGVTLMMSLSASGDLQLKQTGAGVRIAEGANCKQGVATLVAGTVTVSNNTVTANSRIFLTAQDNSTTGALRVSARTAGTSFTITSSNAADSGLVAYEIFEPS